MNECLKCKSKRVIEGEILGCRGDASFFKPKELRMFAFTMSGGTQISKTGFACLDCGLVWSTTSAEELDAFVKKNCKVAP